MISWKFEWLFIAVILFFQHVQGELAEESLTEIPISILETVNFYTTVDLSYNSISKIAPNLALQMPHLTHLNFSHNSLKEIPQSIALLFHLEELLLRGNKITHLPNEIGLLYNLQMLDVSHNLLSKLPDELGNLQNLLRLNVSHNALKALPLSLGSCPNLSILLATFNQLVEPPQNVCNDSEELLSYLRNRTPPVLAEELLNYFPRIRSNVAHSELEDSARTEYVKIQTQTSKPASRTKTPMLLPANATLCSQQTLSDKIIGNLKGTKSFKLTFRGASDFNFIFRAYLRSCLRGFPRCCHWIFNFRWNRLLLCWWPIELSFFRSRWTSGSFPSG